GEAARLGSGCGLDANLLDSLRSQAIPVSVLVSEWTSRIVKRLNIDVGEVRRIVGAHPATVFVVANVWQRKSKPCIACEIPPFVAMNVTFINLTGTKEWKVGIDKKKRMARCTFCWTNGPTIRTGVGF